VACIGTERNTGIGTVQPNRRIQTETKPRYYEVLAQASIDARSGTAALPRLQPLAA